MPASVVSAPSHLSHVLARSRAQIRRRAGLSQSLELAIWANHDDEVHYRQQSHHTLSVYLAGGQGSQLKDDALARGEAGRFCVLPAEHESRWLVREPVQFLHLYVSDIAWADRVVRLLDAEPRSITLTPQIYSLDPIYAQWAQSLWRLDWSGAHDIWQADCLSQQVLDRLVLQSAAPWQRHKLLKPLGGLSSTARRKVLDYVEAHLADSRALSLPALAQVVALSEYHFARMFHQSMGCTVHDWVMQRRLQQVCARLQGSAGSARRRMPHLAWLAAETGFANASHLLRSFRKQYGLTPTQLARCWRDA
ncbi:AraC family transcriptional regulator [Comamonas thiooxydans]|uniref:AraC family transcriptional regulator n=1 Tax=Comamonas thiooxydans TaxID=363952 RepID=UPI002447378C|nr:AraC family transcriptional regulator [Comamonas thiooxydans]MDH1474160.1 AraC family transcriptional regulator [Comamonas thiooxydans]